MKAIFQKFLGNKIGQVVHSDIVGNNTFSAGAPMVAGNGRPAAQKRSLTGAFDALDVRGFADVTYTRSESVSCEVRWDENLLEHVLTEVRGGVLCIGIAPGLSISSTSPLIVTISGPSLHEAVVSGSGGLELRDVQQDALSVELSGSGDIKADGAVRELQVEVSGSGDIQTRKLKAADVTVKVSGSGDAKVYASDSVKVRVSGSADVTVYGSPKKRDTRVSGSGDIEFADQ